MKSRRAKTETIYRQLYLPYNKKDPLAQVILRINAYYRRPR